ncbi:FAD/NAD(P)-binding domain-containing protein [Testicularia cyperi]|uniref:FAD/NAD(P)-binding domain-containing protein n=1 Tax=Testicularia cyperi TaxID=1882483 RepID=A0A317XH12_9BASI|nr:FAD/NAD(P)-binding domain-containing protein [Testicularia cyperi]
MASNNSSVKRLHVIVIGAGIAGLAAGRALREHHDVTILEQSRFKTETGAAIHCGPNASRILQKWGMNMERLESPNCRNIYEYNAEGKLLYHRPVDTTKIFGAPWLLNHRIALHRELLYLATSDDPAIPGKPATIRLASKVVSVDGKAGKVTLADGTELEGDLIIGGDGIKSTLQDYVLGKAAPAKPSGHSAYRFLIPFERLHALNDPDIERVLAEPSLSMIVGSDRRVVCYTCKFEGKDLLNIVAMVPDEGLFEDSCESWSAPGSLKDLAASFSEFCPLAKTLLSAATECALYQLRDQEPLSSWCRDRCIIIGDAAHPMLPHLGQGGSQAIEDAEAIAHVLATHTNLPESMPDALARVQKIRWYRATMAQERSRQQALGPRPGTKEALLGKNTFEFTGFLYDYFGAEDWEQRMREGRDKAKDVSIAPQVEEQAPPAVTV